MAKETAFVQATDLSFSQQTASIHRFLQQSKIKWSTMKMAICFCLNIRNYVSQFSAKLMEHSSNFMKRIFLTVLADYHSG